MALSREGFSGGSLFSSSMGHWPHRLTSGLLKCRTKDRQHVMASAMGLKVLQSSAPQEAPEPVVSSAQLQFLLLQQAAAATHTSSKPVRWCSWQQTASSSNYTHLAPSAGQAAAISEWHTPENALPHAAVCMGEGRWLRGVCLPCGMR